MEFIRLATQMREELQKISTEHKIDLYALISEPHEDNQKYTNMILDMLYKYSRIQIDKYGLFEEENKDKLISALTHSGSLSFGDRFLNSILKIYLNDIWGVFVTAKNSKATPNGVENFQLPASKVSTMQDLEHNSQYIEKKIGNIYLNKYRQLAVFILPDGKCYYAPKDHMSLATWLNMNGVDIKGALRLEINDAHNGIDLSTLGNSKFSKASNEDYLVKITNEQVESLALIINAVKLTRKKDVTIEDCLYNSWGLGCSQFDFDEQIGTENVKRISYEFRDLNRNAYMQRVRTHHANASTGESGGVE